MRLFLSAGTVRRVRIMLLRATHLPFVAMIWAYEHSRRHLHRPTGTSLPPLSASHPQRTHGGDRSRSRCQDSPFSSVRAARRADPKSGRMSIPHDIPREPRMAYTNEAQLTRILNTMDQLRVQVERLNPEPLR
ncbi:hypothetical protein POX_d04832 [Penicillium oxalicum]|uniref:Uncharacterized protein n=1 Tax=Penicillium oxalicum (strain 114-2 / CGMCC 5302) TaxID=933388 RepID=S8B2G1_PENO1|nr:hypothetical protein POX_d04832 [Penicillium oxalicum]EPS33018.1 hypothetical protein PDE_07979 [Penicillium oxalicum 114-2]KAI2789344.1 hypothetical protein POX_d04832 [Penicillium oxalicum]